MGRLYIADETGFFVVDSDTDEIVDHVPLDFEVNFIAVNSVTNQIFVLGVGDGIILDAVTYSTVRENITGYLSDPSYFAFNPTTNHVYIGGSTWWLGEADHVLILDGSNFSRVAIIEIPGSREAKYVQHVSVAVNPQTNLLYATWSGDVNIYVIDCETNKILRTARSLGGRVMVNPATGYLYQGARVLDDVSFKELMVLSKPVFAVNYRDNLVISRECARGSLSGVEYLSILDGASHEMLVCIPEAIEEVDQVAVNTVTGEIYVVDKEEKKVFVMEEHSGPYNHVVINEFELNPPGDDKVMDEWVKLYNPTSSDVDIGGWSLLTNRIYWIIPQGTVIESGGYYVCRSPWEEISDESSRLLNENESITLCPSLYDHIDITPVRSDLADDDRTWQRSPDGCDNWLFQKSTKPVSPEPTEPESTEPEQTEQEPTTPTEPEPTTPEPTTPEPTEPTTETPLITTEVAIIAGLAVACIIGIVAFWALKRK